MRPGSCFLLDIAYREDRALPPVTGFERSPSPLPSGKTAGLSVDGVTAGSDPSPLH